MTRLEKLIEDEENRMRAIIVNGDGTYTEVTNWTKEQREGLEVLEFESTTDKELAEYAKQWSKGCLVL